MQVLTRPWGAMHYAVSGPENGPAVVFANSLGTDLRLWDAVLPLLPPGLRLVRYDKRGHGLSDRSVPYAIADLAEDAAALIDALRLGPVVFVGLSIGGLIGQALASARPDLLRGLVISNSAAKLGTAESWQTRIDAVKAHGLAHIADAVMERWFAPPFRATAELAPWRNMLIRSDAPGYAAACAALAAADQTAATAALRLPVMVIGGAADGACPPDVSEATARLIPGARYHCIPGAGHLPSVETPAEHAALLTAFLKDLQHV
jgi:3-oxoadipate enol-lactonase